MELTFSTWEDYRSQGIVAELRDDQTPSGSVRFARVTIPDREMMLAYRPEIIYVTSIEMLVKMFNRTAGKKVKIVPVTEELEKSGKAPIMLPYNIGLIYYSDAHA